MKTGIFQSNSKTRAVLKLIGVVPAVLVGISLFAADRDEHHDFRGGGADFRGGRGDFRGGAGFRGGGTVERFNHGSIRHSESHIFRPPVPSFRGEERHFVPRHDVFIHRDVDVGFRGPHFWHDFAFHRHIAELPHGFLSLRIGGLPYFYWGGIYYQPAEGGYEEVYPPVGAAIPEPPEGSIQIYAGGQTYYYAGGAFYVQQPDGQFVIAPTPIGVVVPELPPGAVEVNVNGQVAYQFNGIYYQPVFVNGVTQYQTFMP
jgi:Family of unknown function (DUF6515)